MIENTISWDTAVDTGVGKILISPSIAITSVLDIFLWRGLVEVHDTLYIMVLQVDETIRKWTSWVVQKQKQNHNKSLTLLL